MQAQKKLSLHSKESYLDLNKVIKSAVINTKYKGLTFSPDEKFCNKKFKEIVKNFKSKVDEDFYHQNTLKYINLIDKSDVFQIIQRMPKGAIHHTHLDCCYHFEWFLPLLYQPNIYINMETYDIKYAVKNEDPTFRQLIAVKNSIQNLEEFETTLKNQWQFHNELFENKRRLWDEFEKRIGRLIPVIFHQEIFYEFLIHVFEDFYLDGIDHFESRFLFGYILDENNQKIGIEKEILIIRKAITETQKKYPDFTCMLIMQLLKCFSLEKTKRYTQELLEFAKNNNDIIRGYDFVQEEDKHKYLVDFYEAISYVKIERAKNPNFQFPFIFHAGETLEIDNKQIFDVLAIGTYRIGHGLNLVKHSYLFDEIKKQNICIEMNPLSNQVLQYYSDLRTHPLVTFYNYGINVSISPDDPGYFGQRGVSYDFFVVAVAMGLDLLDLKRIALNSLEYSLLDEDKKTETIKIWSEKWNQFINYLKNKVFSAEEDQKNSENYND